MAEESKQMAVMVFLFILFIILAVIIFVFIFSAYRDTTEYSEETTKTSVECASYSFRIEGGSISYEEGALSFVIDPRMGGAREKNPLIIVIGDEEIETQPIDFNFRQRVRLAAEKPENFQVYPKGCRDMIKTCHLAENRCE